MESSLSIKDWLLNNELKLLFSFLVIIIYIILRRIIYPKVEEYIKRDKFKNDTFRNAVFTLNLFSGVISFILILLIWGVGFKSLLAVSTGLIAITGVALFANWSILSNVTAFFLLLSHKSYRRDNYIRVLDLDNFIEGYISDINLFNTKLISENNEVIIYPNNLIIARPVIINPEKHHSAIGKIQDLIIKTNDIMD